MASPQKENGFIAIANEFFDSLNRIYLSDYERRIINTVIRFTYGYNKK